MNICPNVYEHLSMDKFFVERTINNLDSILETSSIFAINNSNSVRRTSIFFSSYHFPNSIHLPIGMKVPPRQVNSWRSRGTIILLLSDSVNKYFIIQNSIRDYYTIYSEKTYRDGVSGE